MAALALMTAACSNDDNDFQAPEQPANAEGIPFTATISIGESASTRALTENGTTIEATWADDEKVALIYDAGGTPTKTETSVTKQTDGTATISATLASGATDGSNVTIIYPASAADGTTGNVKADVLAAQDGTLTGTGGTSIAEKYDVRKGTGKLSISGGKATVNNGTAGTPVSLTNQNAIFKLTLKDINGSADVSATSVVISDQTGVVTTVTPASAASEMYVALPTTATTLKFMVTGSDSKNYFNMASGLTLGASYYQSTIKLATVGDVILSSGKCAKAGTSGAVAKITYLGSDNGEAAPYNHGLALAMSDAGNGGSLKWSTSTSDAGHTKQTDSNNFTSESGLQYNDATHNSDTYPAFKAAIANNSTTAPTGCSAWFLASGYQWTKMAGAVGGYDKLGLESFFYWSSSEYDAFYAWVFYAVSGIWSAYPKDYDDPLVRSCFAF